MDDSKNPDGGDKPKRQLPPELAFLKQLPNFDDLEAEELIAYVHNLNARILQQAALIREYGMDPDYMIGMTKAYLHAAEQACRKSDEADAKAFQAMADSADAQRELFKSMEAIVSQAYEERPFDPEVQEAKEFVDEWRKHMPKE